MTEEEMEIARKYLNDDCQRHLQTHGKWWLDPGKFITALQVAGVGIERRKSSNEEAFCADFVNRADLIGLDLRNVEASVSRLVAEHLAEEDE